ncbi:Por secretion system C-terminal sorting domain-containing protein [Reichenbachiella faecimaris]|uniref:Por secretion system C-terminal sorting domain-containing protein n=1 Tax=Reichenbachiella faecimaris TaxID=692418 RepID=A0A1W2G516_REIFA|nr:T9SS type A sorting domain-containing protein [Reichenbachiella faecimaris]SMD31779.1 Por secretion system C-terminal sorting domain-containing protein [Reichenbachiella faecimaris]
MKNALILLAIALLAQTSYGQKFYWAESAKSHAHTSDIRAIEVMEDGGIVAFGTFNSALHIGDFELEESESGTSFFLAKYDLNGNVEWANKIECDDYLTITHNQVGLAVDDDDNVYISSVYHGKLIFDEETLTNSEATSDFFVAKYAKDGTYQYAWGQGADHAVAVDLAVDELNQVYVAGHYAGDLGFNDPSETTLTSSGSHDAFIAKYDDEGQTVWARSFGDADNYDLSYGVEVSGSSVYWGVNYREGTTSKSYFISVIKLDSDNELLWTHEAGSTDSGVAFFNQAYDLKAYGSDLYVAGYFRGGIQLDGQDEPLTQTEYQALAFKITDNEGSAIYKWATEVGNSNYDYGYAIAKNGNSVYLSRFMNFQSYIEELSDATGVSIESNLSTSKGPNDREYIYDIEAYSSNRIVFGGWFYQNIYYGELGNWTSNDQNLFLCKSNLSVEPDWLASTYGYSMTYAKSVLDDEGNTYVGGSFSGIMKDGEGMIRSKGGTDILVEKYNALGGLVYRKVFGSELDDYLGDLTTYDNELYVTGVFDVYDGSVSMYIEEEELSGDEDKEIFLAKYSESGDLDFAMLAASTEGDLFVQSVGIDQSGNIYLYGDARGGSPKHFGNDVAMSYDEQGFFLAKYNNSGEAQWVQSVNDTDEYKMSVSAQHGIYISGKYTTDDLDFEGTNLIAEGFEDIFFANYDYDGNFQWVVGGGGPSADVINGIASDPTDGSVYLTGYFTNNLTLSGQSVTGTNKELFVVKYDHEGTYQWMKSGGGAQPGDQGKAIALDTAGNVIVVGQYEGDDATFDDYQPGGSGEYEIEALLLLYSATDGELMEGYHWGYPTNYLEGDDKDVFKSIYVDTNNDLSITGQFVGEVSLDTIAVPIYDNYSQFVTKMSLSDCAYVGKVDFEYDGTLHAEETINFSDLTDLGAHTIDAWYWNFGDDETSTDQNPTHSFGSDNEYDISLIITYNESCQLSVNQSIIIEEKINTIPETTNPILDMELDERFASTVVDISEVFSDEDGDSFTYEFSSSNTSVVTLSLSETDLTITEMGVGQATITLKANDGNEGEATDTFVVEVLEVNRIPSVMNPLSDLELDERFASTVVDISEVFSDEDGDSFTYEFSSSNTSVVTLSLSGTDLTITEVGVGQATITLTANDGNEGEATDTFVVEVLDVNRVPSVMNPLSDMVLAHSFVTSTVDISLVFDDADDDDLDITPSSSDESVVTVAIENNQLVITEVSAGDAVVTLTASDNNGGQVADDFLVTVEPYVLGGIGEGYTLRIYPNPTSHIINIEFGNEMTESLQLFDLSGQLIATYRDTTSIDLGNMNSGTYVLQVVIGSQQYFRRIIKN